MYRDLPPDQRIGGYPRPGQLDGTIDEATLDSEGRCVILEFPAFVLFGVYSPANRDQSRNDFRLGFVRALDVRIRNLVKEGKQVILTGDLNIIRSEIDTTNLAETLRKEGMDMRDWMDMPARRIFNHLIFEGDVVGSRDESREEPVLWDLCRCFHPERQGMNTCWDTKRNTRPANNGSRIDYILCSDGIKDWFDSCNIQEGLMGSDHCPVYATLSHRVKNDGKEQHLLELLSPPGVYDDGQRTRELDTKDLLPLSAKLIPEFDRRQSIRDMFTKKAGPNLSRQPADVAGTVRAESTADSNGFTDTSNGGDSAAASKTITSSSPRLTPIVSDSIETPPAHSIPKRPAEANDTTTNRTLKRSKSSTSANDTKSKAPSVPPGQMTLQGFFKPKAAASRPQSAERGPPSPKRKPPPATRPSPAQRSMSPPAASSVRATSKDPRADSDKVFDPIQAKESWSKLLGKRVLPRCEHNEPCISLTTKKPGVNCGTFTRAKRSPLTSFVPTLHTPAVTRQRVMPLREFREANLNFRALVLYLSTAARTIRGKGEGD